MKAKIACAYMARALGALALMTAAPALAQRPAQPPAPSFPAQEGDFGIRNFKFHDGESIPELNIHYRTLGQPKRDAAGKITNAVLILHGTGGSGGNFLSARFGGDLFNPGQPLDYSKYYLIMPDGIGHGKSSKPSDGLKAKFPKYDYDDMVDAQHRLLTEKLGVNSLELIIGTSMGCMHAFVWGETWPSFAKRLMPLACAPTQLAGRNRGGRQMMIDAIKADPDYLDGDYTKRPIWGLRVAAIVMANMGGSPLTLQKAHATTEAANAWADQMTANPQPNTDPNDFIYQLDSSRTYNPEANLEKITANVLWVNSADDYINPPELGFDKTLGPRIKHLRFVLIPISDQTAGHGTHSIAALWKDDLQKLMNQP
jgi:homoserine O-acetyltransferase